MMAAEKDTAIMILRIKGLAVVGPRLLVALTGCRSRM